MTIQSSGTISMSDLRSEYAYGSNTPISLGDLYRGGTKVKGNASDNSATNLSAGVPTSGTISFNNFYGQQRGWKKTIATSASNVDMSSHFGADYSVDYPKDIVINSGVTISSSGLNQTAANFPSGAQGTLTIQCNGTISAKGGTCLSNNSGLSLSLTGTGTVDAQDKWDFVPALIPTGSVQISYLGGFGGASGPDIYHNDYGSNMQLKVTRVNATTFGVYWSYNELDYSNRGAGYAVLSGNGDMIPQNADGSFDDTDTGTYQRSQNITSHGRDTRNIAFGSKMINGVRHMWFGTNNKSTSMEVQNNRYIQHGHTQTTLTTSNSRHTSIIQNYTATRFTGAVVTSGFTGTLS